MRQCDIEPVLGHGNQERIEHISEKRKEAERLFDEKCTSICRVVEDYYKRTYKDVRRYAIRLPRLDAKTINEIYVIGHSLAGVDQLYFNIIDNLTMRSITWKVYYYRPEEKDKLRNNLVDASIDLGRIELVPSSEFYDL